MWTSALHEWLVESGTIGAQLTGRYGSRRHRAGLARLLARAVTRYMQSQPDPGSRDGRRCCAQERAYVGAPTTGWEGLRVSARFKQHPEFRSADAQLGHGTDRGGDAPHRAGADAAPAGLPRARAAP